MFGSDYDDADAHCVRCGAAIYFEVGPGPINCHSCGGRYDKTDEQIAQEAVDRAVENARWQRPETYYAKMRQEIDSTISGMEFFYGCLPTTDGGAPPGVIEKARDVMRRLREVRDSI